MRPPHQPQTTPTRFASAPCRCGQKNRGNRGREMSRPASAASHLTIISETVIRITFSSGSPSLRLPQIEAVRHQTSRALTETECMCLHKCIREAQHGKTPSQPSLCTALPTTTEVASPLHWEPLSNCWFIAMNALWPAMTAALPQSI